MSSSRVSSSGLASGGRPGMFTASRGAEAAGWLLARERTKPMEEARDMSSSRMDVAADSSMDEGLEVEPTSPSASCREPALEGWTGKEAAHLWEMPFRVW